MGLKRSLDPETWKIMSPLLDRALDLEPTARLQLLESLHAEQPEIAGVLGSLLQEHERLLGNAFLEFNSPMPAATAAPPTLAGTTIGAYTLDAAIGAGGMGSVWLAHRSDGYFDARVAIKVLHLSFLDSAGTQRFHREGLFLGRLSHPHIARLLDAGITPAGQPFIVLEYIEGTKIDEYADAHQLDLRARLELFLQVADAVAHAHAHLIVHRDLKPGNILVDTSGQVKLLDFGIAKLLDAESPHAIELTHTNARALTPKYAAPEQLRGEEVTTATDVYALGVLLYQLLVDGHPTGPQCTSAAEHAKAVLDTEPLNASTALDTRGNEATSVAASRGTTVDRLRRTLRGDLDNILAMSLRKQPGRRYATVTAFADDLRRYLRSEAVAARPASWRYRAQKFVWRNRVAVGVAAIVGVTLAGATIVTTNQMIEARQQRDEAAFQARRAQASSEFMRNLVTQIGTTPMTMRQVLDRGREALEKQYGDDPAFVSRMLTQLSGPYGELGDEDTVAAMTARALELAVKSGDASLIAGSHCDRADDAINATDYQAARRHLDEAKKYIATLPRPSTGLLVECAIAESQLADGEERFDAAIAQAAQAVAWLERDGNTASTRYTSALNNLAYVYGDAGRLMESVGAQQRVSAISKQIGRGRTSAMMVSLNNQGSTQRALGWWLTAERSFSEAIAIARGIDPDGEPAAGLQQHYGRILLLLGRPADARGWLQRALAKHDVPQRFVNGARMSYVTLLLNAGELAAARTEQAQLERDVKAPIPVERMRMTIAQARLAAADGDVARARTLVKALLTAEGYPAKQPSHLQELLEEGARLALQAGDHADAARLAREAIALCESHFGTETASAYTGRARLTLGLALIAGGQPAAARPELDRAATLLAAAAGEQHPWTQEARTRLASLAR